MSEPGAVERWLLEYVTDHGESKLSHVAGPLVNMARAHDAGDARRDAVLRQAREALEKSVDVVRTWHDIELRRLPDDEAERCWQIYRDQSPELEPVRAALAAIDALEGR